MVKAYRLAAKRRLEPRLGVKAGPNSTSPEAKVHPERRARSASFPLSLRPLGSRVGRLRRQGLDVVQRWPKPSLHRILGARRRIGVDISLHPAASHLHRSDPRLRQRFVLTLPADPQKKAALGRSGDEISVHHESDAAEHLDLAQCLDALKSGPHPQCEITFGAHFFGLLRMKQHIPPPHANPKRVARRVGAGRASPYFPASRSANSATVFA